MNLSRWQLSAFAQVLFSFINTTLIRYLHDATERFLDLNKFDNFHSRVI